MKHRLAAACAILLSCWISQTYAQSPPFVPGPPVTIAGGTGYVGLFDLNQDGHLDLISGPRASGGTDVRLGDGRGRFGAPLGQQANFGIKHATMALGDVNGDGILDCVQASKDAANEYVHIFIGVGDGRFRTPGSRVTANRSVDLYKPQLWFGDVNEDRKIDIVTQNGRRNTVEIFMGDGRGGFATARIVKLEEGFNLYTAALGDMDRDGHLDIAVAMSPLSTQDVGRVSLLRGNGAGEFSQTIGTPLVIETSPGLAALSDLNGDSRLDIVVSHGEKELLSVLLSSSDGKFAKPLTFALAPGTSAFTVVVGDVNRDRQADLIVGTVNSVARPYNSAVVVLKGNGSTFVPAGSPFGVGPGAYRLASGDINEDGKLDIVTSSFESDAVSVLLGQ